MGPVHLISSSMKQAFANSTNLSGTADKLEGRDGTQRHLEKLEEWPWELCGVEQGLSAGTNTGWG